MSRDNISERRRHIKTLLDAGQEIDVRALARKWDSSPASIIVDVSVVRGLDDPYRAHPAKKQNERARRMGAQGEITVDEWNAILKANGYACVRCGSTSDLAIDHIVPLSKGGKNTADNIQPLCRRCNSSKGNR